jgi:hypothetical protein
MKDFITFGQSEVNCLETDLFWTINIERKLKKWPKIFRRRGKNVKKTILG